MAGIIETEEIAEGEYPRVLPGPNLSGRVEVGFLVGSEFNNDRSTVVIERGSFDQWLDQNNGGGSDYRYPHTIPLGAEVRELGNALARAGFTDERGVLLRDGRRRATSVDIRLIAARITGVYDKFFLGSLIVVILPPAPEFDWFGEQTSGPADAVAMDLGTFEPAPPGRGRGNIQVINPDTGRKLGEPREIWDILRDYRIADKPLRLPYKNVDLNDHTEEDTPKNCLRRYCIRRYHDEPKGKKKIACKSINRILGEDPTTEQLVAFTNRYKIRTTLLDVSGRVIFKTDGVSKDRPPFTAILYANHLYPYTGNLRGHIDLGIGAETDLAEYKDDRVVADDPKRDAEAFERFLKTKFSPNFHYKAESGLVHQALMWYGREAPTEDATCWDMTSAYDTVVRKLADETEEIPVFTAHDIVEEFDHSLDDIVDYGYYWVGKATSDRWQAGGVAYAKARINDILTGYEARYLIKRGHLSKREITYQKTPSYTTTLSKFRAKLDAVCGGAAEAARGKSYPLYNGMLGRPATRDGWMCFTGASLADVELLAANRDATTFDAHEHLDGTFQIRTKVKYGKYLYFNNRNLYNYVVGRTNLEMMRFIDETLAENPGARVLKIKTDGVVFSEAVAPPEAWAAHFHAEKVLWSAREYTVYSTAPDWMRDTTIREVVAWREKCRIVTGPPGTGKTHLIKSEDAYDVATTITNACARNLDSERLKGETIYKALQLYSPENLYKVISALRDKTLWLDEFSMMPRYIWSFLYIIGQHTTLTILTGDQHQLPPVGEDLDYGGTFLRTLFVGEEVLEKDWRNDDKIIRLRNRIRDEPDQETLKYLEELAKDDEHTVADDDDPAKYTTHLVRTHKVRRKLNAYIVNANGYKWSHRLKREAQRPEGLTAKFHSGREYSYEASAGLILAARITRKNSGIYKGSRYRLLTDVVKDTETFKLYRLGDDDLGGTEYPIDTMKLFGLGYAVTVDSAQGLTVRDPFVIWEVKSMLVGRRAESRRLYTAVTRGVRFSDIRIVLGNTHSKLAGMGALPEIDWKELGVDEDAYAHTFRFCSRQLS
jgi:hypothetical protein